MRLELVRDWMSRDVVSVRPDSLLPDANRLMLEERIRRLPVVEDGRLLGIITYGDIRAAQPSSASGLGLAEINYLTAQIRVAAVMTRKLVTVSQNATIGQAAELMLNHAIGGLPVLDEKGKLVGILTESDIFRLVVHGWRRAQDQSSTPYTHYG
jgi:CBS domain-containing protein